MAETLERVTQIIATHAAALRAPGVFSLRPGYRCRDGWITREPAIVVVVDRRAPRPSLPAAIAGIPVDVRRATPAEQLRFAEPRTFAEVAAGRPELQGGAWPELDLTRAASGELAPPPPPGAAAKPSLPYTAPAGVALDPVTGPCTIVCHASPDAGWPTLRSFLTGVGATLTVGLYDFTSAHILAALESALQGGKRLILTLDNPARNPTADQTDAETRKRLAETLGDAARTTWALVRSNKQIPRWIYPTAYHIKVAVKDSRSFWLSSGNWNNSNQPDVDPVNDPGEVGNVLTRSDRDWHVIVEHAGLAQIYEAFLRHDFEVALAVASGEARAGGRLAAPLDLGIAASLPEEVTAPSLVPVRFFTPLVLTDEPMTVQPLLTPDNYQPHLLELIRSAETSLFLQLQYIHPSDQPDDAPFTALIDAVVAQIQAGKDVRIILGAHQADNGWLEKLQAVGVELGVVRLQSGAHTLGVIVDGKTVALGSHIWSGVGALRNRDASLIIHNEKAARYFQQIFLHDWENLARTRVSAAP